LSSSRSPERAILIADERASIAESWPKITSLRSRSSVFSASRSDADTFFGGIRAILAMMFSMSTTSTDSGRSDSGCSRQCAPASSITSMALSGR
jgi:hypothetical protein